jgi:uncharacterized membrane protein YcaP (DUF421 family)
MTENSDKRPELDKRTNRLAAWVRIMGIVFRLLIILGLLLLGLAAALVLFTDIIPFWVLVLPIILLAIGIWLAWLEYRLHDRVYHLQQGTPDHAVENGDVPE